MSVVWFGIFGRAHHTVDDILSDGVILHGVDGRSGI